MIVSQLDKCWNDPVTYTSWLAGADPAALRVGHVQLDVEALFRRDGAQPFHHQAGAEITGRRRNTA